MREDKEHSEEASDPPFLSLLGEHVTMSSQAAPHLPTRKDLCQANGVMFVLHSERLETSQFTQMDQDRRRITTQTALR